MNHIILHNLVNINIIEITIEGCEEPNDPLNRTLETISNVGLTGGRPYLEPGK